MRPYLILTAVVLLTVAAFGQQPVPRPYGGCFYGCSPSIPLVTTPEISLQQVSPNPVGATNATTGLIAGATNSTLSQIQGSTSSVYTEAVWYQGGAPLITPQVHLWPETIGREGRAMREAMPGAMFEERPQEEGARGQHPREGLRGAGRQGEERGATEATSGTFAYGTWTYLSGPTTAPRANDFKKAGHVYGNDDVTRQNDKNGAVKYGGKTEKL
jgi:hypothetical protein